MGTAAYFSPEQAEGAVVDGRSDLYSLGVVLFEMLAGRPPFVGDSPVAVASMHVRNPPPPLRDLSPAVPEGLERVTMHALAKSPGRPLPDRRGVPRGPAALHRGPAGARRAPPTAPASARPRSWGRATSARGRGATIARPRRAPARRRGRSPPRRRQRGGAARLRVWPAAAGRVARRRDWPSSPTSPGRALAGPARSRCPTSSASRWPRPTQMLTSEGLRGARPPPGRPRRRPATVLSTDPAGGPPSSKKGASSTWWWRRPRRSRGDGPSVVGDDLGAPRPRTCGTANYRVKFVTSPVPPGLRPRPEPAGGYDRRRRAPWSRSRCPRPSNQVPGPECDRASSPQAAASTLCAVRASPSDPDDRRARTRSLPTRCRDRARRPGPSSAGRDGQPHRSRPGACPVVVPNVVGEHGAGARRDSKRRA